MENYHLMIHRIDTSGERIHCRCKDGKMWIVSRNFHIGDPCYSVSEMVDGFYTFNDHHAETVSEMVCIMKMLELKEIVD